MKTIYKNELALTGSWLADKGLENLINSIRDYGELIQTKKGKSVYCLRNSKDGNPYLVKTWCGNGFKNWFKNSIRIGNPYAEFRNTLFLNKLGIRSPELYYFGIASSETCGIFYIQVSEFIKTKKNATQHIKELLDKENYDEVREFSNKIKLLTGALLDVRLVDPDHRMVNLMVNEAGEPVKIDLEIASIMSKYRFYENKIGDMLGTLIYSYIFAVQPHLDIARDFSDSIIQEINPSQHARKRAKKVIQSALSKQYAEINIDSQIPTNF